MLFLRWFARLVGVPFPKSHNARGHRKAKRPVVRIRPLRVTSAERREIIVRAAEARHAGYPTTAAFKVATSRYAVYTRSKGVCALCHRHVNWFAVGGQAPSVDHIRPLAKGGQHHPDNLQLTHWACNRAKGARWMGRR